MGRHTTRAPEAPSLCHRCGSPRVVDYGAQVICARCGYVMQADAVVVERYPPVCECGGTLADRHLAGTRVCTRCGTVAEPEPAP